MDPLRANDPQVIGTYALLSRLGAGGMGQVYLGRSPGGRLVAIKVIRDEITDHPEALARFRREVDTVRAVRSAYTASLIDASLDAAPYWLATEYVAGPTLARAVGAQGPLPAATCVALGAALAEGLAAVHAYEVTHRDLKPQNVILAAQGPQLIDFGIARGAAQTALTDPGGTPGTPGFTAPEVLMGRASGPAADVFALGATLAYAATGRPPFGSGEPAGVSYRAVHEPIDLAGVPEPLAGLVEACVAKDPARRPTPAEVIARCSVRTALVEDPAYAALVGPGEPVPTGPAPATPTPTQPGPHALPTQGAPAPYGYTPTYLPPAPASRRRGWILGTSAGLGAAALGVAAVLIAQNLMGGDGDPDARGGGGGKPTGSSSASRPSSPSASASPAKDRPKYIDNNRISRDYWTADDSEQGGACNMPAEERYENFQTTVEPDRVTGEVEVAFRDKYAPQGEKGHKPYYVAAAVKPPHDIDPDTGKPYDLGEGRTTQNLQIGYSSVPVDLYDVPVKGDDPLIGQARLTYPDDFESWVEGKRVADKGIPLGNDPGDWTVLFFHVKNDPSDYTLIGCSGFTWPR
ncbi:protein kinase domain-containing protein [Streptomyces sp. WG-D5]